MIIEYREPSSIEELDALFRLRQEVYSQDVNLSAMISADQSHDINAYDLRSCHFGAFSDGNAIGYVRLAMAQRSSLAPWVEEICATNRITLNSIKHSFPFVAYYPDKKWSSEFILGLAGKRIGEVGKLAIHQDYRNGDDHLNELISSFLDYCVQEHRIETGFGSCTLLLERYYRKFGFFVAAGAKPFVFGNLPEAVILRFDP